MKERTLQIRPLFLDVRKNLATSIQTIQKHLLQ